MTLDKFMLKNGISNTNLAKRLEVNPSYVSLLRNRKKTPSLDIAIRIHLLTGGQTTFRELVKK